jgi:hypothetical protein
MRFTTVEHSLLNHILDKCQRLNVTSVTCYLTNLVVNVSLRQVCCVILYTDDITRVFVCFVRARSTAKFEIDDAQSEEVIQLWC